MKAKLCLTIAAALMIAGGVNSNTFGQGQGEIQVNYDPLGPQSSTVPLPPAFEAPGVTAGFLTLTGMGSFTNTDRYPVGTITAAASIDLSQYISFLVDSNGNFAFDTVQHDAISYGNGPTVGTIRSSVDGFSSNLDTLSTSNSGLNTNIFRVQGLGVANDPVEFRIYYWNSNNGFADIGSSAGGTTGLTVRGFDQVYDNGAGGASGIDGCSFSDDDIPQILADDVILTSDTRVTHIAWTGLYSPDNTPPASEFFSIRIYADDDGSPGEILDGFGISVTGMPTGETLFGFDVYDYSYNFEFCMQAGTRYWISISSFQSFDNDFCLGFLAGTGNNHFSLDGGDTWTFGGDQHDLRVFGGDAPDPPATIGTFTPTGFGYSASDLQTPDFLDVLWYEIIYDGLAPLNIQVDDDASGVVAMGFYDSAGGLIESEYFSDNSFDFDSLPAGSYFLGITDAGGFFDSCFEVFPFGLPIGVVTTTITTAVYDNDAGGAAGADNCFFADDDQPQRVTNEVTLTQATNIDRVVWTGLYINDGTPPNTDDFTIAIYADDGGVPTGGSPIASFNVGNDVNRTLTSSQLAGFDIYQYSATIDFTMQACTTYWVSIFSNSVDDTNDNFCWSGLITPGENQYFSSDGGNTWLLEGTNPTKFDFTLFGITEPVYDNGSQPSTIDQCLFADDDVPQRVVNDVTLSTTTNITRIQWSGVYTSDNTPPPTDDFTIDIYADNAGAPVGGSPIASFNVGNAVNRTFTGITVALSSVFDLYQFSADIDFTMQAGTTYWVSISGNTVGENDTFCWGGVDDPSDIGYASTDGGNSWFLIDGGFETQLDFKLFGTPLSIIMTVNIEDPSSVIFQTTPVNAKGSFMDAAINGITLSGFFSGNAFSVDEMASSGGIEIYDSAAATTTSSLTSVFVLDFAGGYTTDDLAFYAGAPFDTFTFDDQRALFSSATHDLTPFTGVATTGEFGNILIGEPDSNQVIGQWQVVSVLLGDANCDGEVNLLDVDPFIALIASGDYLDKADINGDGSVNLLDVDPFIAILGGG